MKPDLLVLELGLLLQWQPPEDTGDHLEGGRMLTVSDVDEAGMNLAGDSNGQSRCAVKPCATVLRCRTESGTGS